MTNTLIVLIGDSIFDNAAYTSGQPSVSEHLQDLLAPDREASLLARDGATTAHIADQIRRLKELNGQGHRIEHVILSVGGNDALQQISILERTVHQVAGALQHVDDLVKDFRRSYTGVLTDLQRATSEIGAKFTACTIYDCDFGPRLAAPGRVILALFNDVILRTTASLGMGIGTGVLDLRRVCMESADYEMEIEPSGQGGEKIAKAIASALQETLR